MAFSRFHSSSGVIHPIRQMNSKQVVTQPISYERIVTQPDGANGFISTSSIVYTTLVEVKAIRPIRTLEAAQASLRQGYLFTQWIDAAFEPNVNDTIIYKGERLTMQGYMYEDANNPKKYLITALEQVKTNATDSIPPGA